METWLQISLHENYSYITDSIVKQLILPFSTVTVFLGPFSQKRNAFDTFGQVKSNTHIYQTTDVFSAGLNALQ
jgi:hypothetical protein